MPRERRVRRANTANGGGGSGSVRPTPTTSTSATAVDTRPATRNPSTSNRSIETLDQGGVRASDGHLVTTNTTTALMPLELVDFDRLFPGFVANRPATPSIPVQKALCERLRSHLDHTLAGRQFRFTEFYELVHQMVSCHIVDSVYRVTGESLHKWFTWFARTLASQMECHSGLGPAEKLVKFHQQYFGDTINRVASALMSAERRLLCGGQNSPPLLHELSCHQFVKAILAQPTIARYLTDLSVVFFSRLRVRVHEEALRHCALVDSLESDAQLPPFLQQYFDQAFSPADQSTNLVMRSVVEMLLALDRQHRSTFGRFLELPLTLRSMAQAQQLAKAHWTECSATQPSQAVVTYLHWTIRYIQADNYLLEHFHFPSTTVHNMAALFCHWTVVTHMTTGVIGHESSGLATCLRHSDQRLSDLRRMHDQLQWLVGRTEQTELMAAVHRHIEAQFADRQACFSALYHFRRRAQMLAYVSELLTIKDRWDTILRQVFHTECSDVVSRAVFSFFHESLLIHEGVQQALAFYLHHQLLRSTSPSDQRSTAASFTSTIGSTLTDSENVLSANQTSRVSECVRFLGLIQYIKDVNSFYDYTRHYFCARLLNSSSALTADQELQVLDRLTTEIQRVFVDDPLVSGTIDGGNNSSSVVHKHFTQSLNDFRWIVTNWKNGDKFFAAYRDKQPHQHSIMRSLPILHAGIWKLVDYERCVLPVSVVNAFGLLDFEHRRQFANKRLLLNTRYGTAVVTSQPWPDLPAVSVRLSLHQLAIVCQFNGTTGTIIPPALTFRQLVAGGQFSRDRNAKLALISLVYGGLLTVTAQFENDVLFELNRRFYIDHQSNTGVQQSPTTTIRDLSGLEEHDFWGATAVDKKTAELMRTLQVDEHDIVLAATATAVEDVAQNCSQILRTATQDSGGQLDSPPNSTRTTSVGTRGTRRTDLNSTTTESFTSTTTTISGQGSHRRITGRSDSCVTGSSRGSSSSGTVTITCATTNTATTTGNGSSSVPTWGLLERDIKVEAAVVRLMKQSRAQHTVHEIFQHTKVSVGSGRAPLPPTDTPITFEEVRNTVLKLVEKKYLRRTQTGGFEYLVD